MKRERRFQKRFAHIKPLADKLFKFIEPLSSREGSLLQRAITYTINQKMNLMNVFLDGDLAFSNNLAERTIRVVTVGRKNWLFAVSTGGANVCEIMYSVFDTAIENGLIPEKYMVYVLEQMPSALGDDEKVQALLPWSSTLPAYLKMSPKDEKELQAQVADARELNKTVGTTKS